MPKNLKSSKRSRAHNKTSSKRYGKHHSKGNRYAKIYAPYLPLVISIIASLFISFWHPNSSSTLAYATEMSASGLLSATNSQRSSNGKSTLTINSQLASAAQAKANHMVTNNYWSHTTPDGQEPWAFIQNAGYSYSKAGENLAYGFATSADTVIGWMNSPTHKANMLDNAFTDVGFGFANSSNFNGDGQQTVVVAMYGKPQALGASSPVANTQPPTSSPTPNPVPTAKPSTPAPTPQPATPISQNPIEGEEEAPSINESAKATPVTTEQSIESAMPISQHIVKAQTLTNGQAPWTIGAATLITGLALLLLLARHSLKARHLFKDIVYNTEKFVLHHPLFDSILLGLAILGATLARTVGTIL